MVGHVRRETAFVAHGHAHALVVDDLLERVEHLGAVAHRLAEARGPHGNDHQFLQVEVVVGVRAAVHHVHHRHRQLHAAHAAEVAVQGQARLFGRRAGHGHGNGQRGVGAQAALVLGAVQVDQRLVQEGLLRGIQAQHRFGDFGVDVLHGLEHALAQVAALVAVAQLDGFARAGGCARGHGRAAHGARLQQHVAFHGGIAARVQDFPADDVNDCAHSSFLFSKLLNRITHLRRRSCASLRRLAALAWRLRIRRSCRRPVACSMLGNFSITRRCGIQSPSSTSTLPPRTQTSAPWAFIAMVESFL